MKRLWRVVRGQAGYSLVELLVVMIILGTILGALTTAFVHGSRAELAANRRVQAQIQAGLAFDRLRRDIHCAVSSDAPTGTPVSTITLSGCGAGPVSWSVSASTSNDCTAGGGTLLALSRTDSTLTRQYADCLISSAFTYTPQVAGSSLAKVHVEIVANVNPDNPLEGFRLQDDIVMRNSTRT